MKTVTIIGKVENLCGLYDELQKESFLVVNVGAEMDKVHVYLEDGETKDPTTLVESWKGRLKPAEDKPACESFWKRLLRKLKLS